MFDFISGMKDYLYKGRHIIPTRTYPGLYGVAALKVTVQSPSVLLSTAPYRGNRHINDYILSSSTGENVNKYTRQLRQYMLLETAGENFIKYNCAPSGWLFQNSELDINQCKEIIPHYPTPKWVGNGKEPVVIILGGITVPEADRYVFSFLVDGDNYSIVEVTTPDGFFTFNLLTDQATASYGKEAGICNDYYTEPDEIKRCWMTTKKGMGNYRLTLTESEGMDLDGWPMKASQTEDGIWVTGFQVERGEYPGRLTITHRCEQVRRDEPDILKIPPLPIKTSLFVFAVSYANEPGKRECYYITDTVHADQNRLLTIKKDGESWTITPQLSCFVGISYYHWILAPDGQLFVINRGF